MIDQLKKAIHQIEKLPESKQIEIAKLIQDELSWDATILQSQDQLASLAKEALKEYKEGKALRQHGWCREDCGGVGK